MMSSQDFERFYESCFGTSFGAVHDGLDEPAVLNLRGAEREEAESLLLQSLGTDLDRYSRPVTALGLLGAKKASNPLKQRLQTATGWDRVMTALALFRIEKFPGAERVILDCLEAAGPNDEAARWAIIGALGYLDPAPPVVRTLLKILLENNMSGFSAAQALRKLFGEDETIRGLLDQVIRLQYEAHSSEYRTGLVEQVAEWIRACKSDITA
jgi:HEAT repeat protein